MISVIIPVFNAEKTIERVLFSLYKQTIHNFEIIVIDDGSTDRTLQILKTHETNKKIRLYTTNHQNAAHARNYGITKAKGEYLCFVDSDDYVNINMIECYQNIIVKHNPDMIISGFDEVGLAKTFKTHLPSDKVYTKKDVFAQDLLEIYKNNLIYNVWNKCYRKAFLIENQILFPDVYFYEDHLFNIICLMKCHTIITCRKVLYYYERMLKQSISSNYIPHLLEIRIDENEKLTQLFEYFSLNKNDYDPFIGKRYLERTIGILENIQLSNLSFKEKRNEIKKMLFHKDTIKYLKMPLFDSYVHKFILELYRLKQTNVLYLIGKTIIISKKLFPHLYLKLKSNR